MLDEKLEWKCDSFSYSEQYNQYVELVGGAIGQGTSAAVRRGKGIFTIADDLPLIHFLSDSEVCDDENVCML